MDNFIWCLFGVIIGLAIAAIIFDASQALVCSP